MFTLNLSFKKLKIYDLIKCNSIDGITFVTMMDLPFFAYERMGGVRQI